MKAISLWQPWASLWCSPRKVHETRHWPTKHRGWLLVHAAKRFEKEHGKELREILDDEFGGHWGLDLPTGALIGMVNLVACKRTDEMFILGVPEADRDDYECGNYAHGRFAWQRAEFQLFDHPIPYKGAQGFFTVPDDLLQIGTNLAATLPRELFG